MPGLDLTVLFHVHTLCTIGAIETGVILELVVSAKGTDNRGLERYEKGQLVVTKIPIHTASDLGGEPGSKFVTSLAKGALLKLEDIHFGSKTR